MWSYIINPFITALTLFYSVTGSIVLSIVVFTVVTRMLLYPLTVQQQKSMRAQQELQPEIKKLQEKYKNDREKLAQEQMKLMQERGANPFGGCLLMFVQLPIFLGLYQAIIYALAATPLQLIDMSGRLLIPGLASEIPLNSLWMGMDLTLPPTQNPWFALSLPVLVVVTTWAQTHLTMGSTSKKKKEDEKDTKSSKKKDKDDKGGGQMDQAQAIQQQMKVMMPLMFGFFSLSFSVGISIYFITSNLIGAFQYGILRRNQDKQAEAEAAAELTETVIEEETEKEKPKKAAKKKTKTAKKTKKATS
ncbi:MAG: YidC/Oxa1 family membrane protein insertase [Chloroflexota bacterium]